MVRDLKCDPSTLLGPPDDRVIAKLQARFALDSAFVEQMSICHGAEPEISQFHAESATRNIGLFLTLYDYHSKLEPPFRPHFDHLNLDERVVDGICYIMDEDHGTSRTLFTNLLPFAALETDMCLDRAYVDLLCLDYRNTEQLPPVVLWVAERAQRAYWAWDDLPIDEQFDENHNFCNVPWDSFLVPISDSFANFISDLQ